ncbi:MAG: YlbF family regulator, partial [Clostridia bacterium]|nr:YlbF family regulator [Clostridia bacterium]
MTKIIELAHMLGEQIAKSDEIKNLEAAKAAFDTDADLQEKMREYETERVLLAQEISKEPDQADEIAISNLKNRLQELSVLINANPLYTAFADAQKAMNALMESVNSEIKFCITGERPSTCTHDCSTC